MKKKILSCLVLLCMVVTLLPTNIITVSAYTGTKHGDHLYYEVESNGEVTITHCDSSATEVEIPSEIDGKPVTKIGSRAFYMCSDLTDIIIPGSVTEIGDKAFYDCASITSIAIPDSVISLGNSAFEDCSGLTSVYVQSLEAYLNCEYNNKSSNPMRYAERLYVNNQLVKGNVEIPNTVKKIPEYAFSNCIKITDITIPDSVTTIGDSAFRYCSGLTRVAIPDSVTAIGDSAFANCSGLTSVTIGDSVTAIGGGAFGDCSGLTSITIPDSVTAIGNYAFSDCSGLTSVTIPDSVTTIGDSAFANCSGLTSVTIGDSVTTIGYWAFSYCSGLTSITIPDSVSTIGDSAFYACGGLTSVTIGGSVTSIGYRTFFNCCELTSVTIPDSVTAIGICAFYNCSGLKSVTIPDSVTSIGDDAFCGCRITTVYYNGTDDEWDEIYIYSGNDALTNATRKSGYEITLIAENEENTTIICWPNTKIKRFDIEKIYMHKVTLYTDSEMTNEFDITTAITDNMTLYVKLGEEIQGTQTTVSAAGNSFTVKPINIKNGNTIILALYNGDKLAEMQSKTYTGEDIPFTTGESYTKAKVFVWSNLTDIMPVCEAEIVK